MSVDVMILMSFTIAENAKIRRFVTIDYTA